MFGFTGNVQRLACICTKRARLSWFAGEVEHDPPRMATSYLKACVSAECLQIRGGQLSDMIGTKKISGEMLKIRVLHVDDTVIRKIEDNPAQGREWILQMFQNGHDDNTVHFVWQVHFVIWPAIGNRIRNALVVFYLSTAGFYGVHFPAGMAAGKVVQKVTPPCTKIQYFACVWHG